MNIDSSERIPGRGAVMLALVLAVLGVPAAAQQGVITGHVTDAATKQGIALAQVTVVGTTLRAITSQTGEYRIANVTPGSVQVQSKYIGYKTVTQSVQVGAGETATLDFAITAASIGLDAITVTPVGDQTKREQGTNTPTIDMATLAQTAPIANMSDALNSRVPGVVVQASGGTTGSGTRIRIRGSNSVSLSNDPVVIVDGVRVEGAATSNSIGVGGQAPSRINDYNAEDLESVQVAEGPSSSVLYGTDAANGVIVLESRKGKPGPTQWAFSSEMGLANDIGKYPDNYRGLDSLGGTCRLTQQAAAICRVASVRTLNPIEKYSPFREGNLEHLGLSASGGTEQTTFYVAGHYNFDNGVYSVDYNKQVFLRANVHHQALSNLSFDVSTGYVSSRLRLPQNDNNSFGVLSSGFLGGTDSTVNQGYGFLTPQQSFALQTLQYVDHFTGSFQAKYLPSSWLQVRATLGNDFVSRQDVNTIVPGTIPAAFSPSANIGSRNSNPFQIYNWTANVWAQANFLLTPSITSQTSAGMQYFRASLHGVLASVLGLTAGSNSLAGGVIPSVSEQTTQTATVGKFADELVGFNNRVFVEGALRSDQNSSFGKTFSNILYPKFSASWVISEEPFFPALSWLNSLKVRAAYGKSGLHPQALDALQYFTPTPVLVGATDVTGITVGNLGNPALKPESDNELEGGFDLDAFNHRLTLTVTGYSKSSHDALIAVTEPPACGTCSTTQFRNLGEISNKGIEISAIGDVLDKPNLGVTLTLSAWGNKNRVVTLGQGIFPILFGLGGFSQRFQPGYAAGAYFMVPYTFNDANKDGIIAVNEVTLGAAPVFLGNPFPDHGLSLAADVSIMRHWHLSGLLDGRFGNKLFNSTEQFRCGFANCQGRNDPKASLADQAAAVANNLGTQAGYIQSADFVKLRELGLTYDAPDVWARQLGAKTMQITLSGRNLATWTKYRGLDPELNEAGQANFTTADFLTQPPIRYWVARVNLTF